MKEHHLKIDQQYLDALLDGRKKSEVRLNDRDYKVGDIIEFWNPNNKESEGRAIRFGITYIHSGLGMQDGYVVLSVARLSYIMKEDGTTGYSESFETSY